MSQFICSVPVKGDEKVGVLERALRSDWEIRQNSDVPKATYGDRPATYIPVEPAPGAVTLRCWFNVRDVIEQQGGKAVFGWSLWKLSNGYHQAVHHGVWERPDGTLVDVTPYEIGIHEVLFMADSRVPFDYENYRVPPGFVMSSESTDNEVLYTWIDLRRKPLPGYGLLRMPKE